MKAMDGGAECANDGCRGCLSTHCVNFYIAHCYYTHMLVSFIKPIMKAMDGGAECANDGCRGCLSASTSLSVLINLGLNKNISISHRCQ